ncbi:MAG TPA: hypothetical protein VIM65_15845 [Cyclobacteriaceae bacterium]
MEGLIKRKPDVQRIDGKNETKPTVINGCIDFSIVNIGKETIYYGFSRDQEPDVPIPPADNTSWPLYRPCEFWDGELFIRFGPVGSVALITKTV